MLKIRTDSSNEYFIIESERPLAKNILFQFPKYQVKRTEEAYFYKIKGGPNSSFIINSITQLDESDSNMTEEAKELMEFFLALASTPEVFLYNDKQVGIEIPGIPYYRHIMSVISAYPKSNTTYTVPFGRAYEVMRTLGNFKGFLPSFNVRDDFNKQFLTPPDSFDGTIPSLFSGDISELTSVRNSYQNKPEHYQAMGYNCIADFVMQQPKRYIDKTQTSSVDSWGIGDEVTFIGKILDITLIKGEHPSYKVDINGSIVNIIYYRRGWLFDKFKIGEEVLMIGKYVKKNNLTGISIDSIIEASSLPIVPIYPQSAKNKINTKKVMNVVYEVIQRLSDKSKDFATYLDMDSFEMSMARAIDRLHFPQSSEEYLSALEVLSFIELFYMQILILKRQENEVKKKGQKKPRVIGGFADKARESLPWTLTNGQDKALEKIDEIMSSENSEQVMVSADVGSGKTLVAQLSCLQAVDNGYQALLVAPTEVLAKQLYVTFVDLIDKMDSNKKPSIVYTGGKLRAKEKREIYKSIEYGDVDIIVGTQGALREEVNYHNLGLIVIDEEQKFGANQRNALINKSEYDAPDIITQTATPIPRSTAQVYYGDINFITIDEKPAGRLDIITEWIKEDPTKFSKKTKSPVWEDIKNEAKLGHKTFVVVPMVQASDKINAANVSDTVKHLSKTLDGLEVEYVHGQMKEDEKTQRMENFKYGSADVLVASTVIEVGVDVSSATRIVILSAERMGASSLHQIRGRVGRNSLQSKCYLVSDKDTVGNKSRLESLVASNNGFDIATVDLKTRGSGDLFGERQSGDTGLIFANLTDHSKLISQAQELAKKVYGTPRKYEAIADATAILQIDKREDK